MPRNEEFLPKKNVFWLVFDTSNGDSLSKRYVWWFDSREAALEHIGNQKSVPYAASLSKPYKVNFS